MSDRPDLRPITHTMRGHEPLERPELVVTCPCGRRMHQRADYGPSTYLCGCGVGVDVDVAAVRDRLPDTGCGVLKAPGVRCGRHVRMAMVDVGGICTPCLRDLLARAASNPAWQDHLLELFGQERAALAQYEAAKRANERREERQAAEVQHRTDQREADAVHVVYYVRFGKGQIKIGTTGHLEERMLSLRVANPDNLLAAEPGSYQLERQRHQQFGKWRYRRRREDFGDAPELLEHIEQVRAEHGDPWALGGAPR